MKNLFALLLFALAATFAQAQTAAITPTSVEIISAGAAKRAFYDLDGVFIRYKTGTVTIYEATNGGLLFSGDTSEISVTGATHWGAMAAKFTNWYQHITTTSGYRYWLPKRGCNLIYNNRDTILTVVNSATKATLLKSHLDSLKISGVTGVSNLLTYIRGKYFLEGERNSLALPTTATVAADTAAGSSPTIAVTGNGVTGMVTLTVGTSPKTSGNLFAVTLPVTYPTGTFVTLTAADSDAAGHIARVYVEGGASSFTVKIAATGLTQAVQYKWYYHVTGY